MRITQETDYALRMIDYLSCSEEEVVGASTLSEELKIPIRFALKILRKLNIYGITKALRGVNGGYYLNKNPQDINYKMVVEAIEGEIYINKCLQDPACCSRNMVGSECPINNNLRKIQDKVNEELEKYTFGKNNYEDFAYYT